MKALQRKILEKIDCFYDREQDRVFLWTPILLGCGIFLGDYLYGLKAFVISTVLLALLSLISLMQFSRRAYLGRGLMVTGLIIISGIVIMMARIYVKATPAISQPIPNVRVTGVVEHVDLLPSGVRMIVSIQQCVSWPENQPRCDKIRLTYRGEMAPRVYNDHNLKFQGRVSLQPLRGPVIKGGYNFKRTAFFQGVGAVGYGLEPPTLTLDSNNTSLWHALSRVRATLRATIDQCVPEPGRKIVRTLVTGDTALIDRNTRAVFANAGIAHLLAISGLHLSLILFLAFVIIRRCLCLCPALALRIHTKKVAAIVALVLSLGYLVISGAPLTAIRALLMSTLGLLAILYDRDVFTLRTVAIAALLMLLFQPESLFTASFQLSFSAVASIVAYTEYGRLQSLKRTEAAPKTGALQRLWAYNKVLIMTTCVTTIATAPITAFTFNQVSLVGVIGNILIIPFFSFILMPLIVLFVCTAYLPAIPHLLGPLIGHLIDCVITVAAYLEAWPHAVIHLRYIALEQQLLILCGLAWVLLWRSRIRRLGYLLVAVGLVLAYRAPKPDIFIGPERKLVMVRLNDNLWLANTLTQERFARTQWLRMQGHAQCRKWTGRMDVGLRQQLAAHGFTRDRAGNLNVHIAGYQGWIAPSGEVKLFREGARPFDSRTLEKSESVLYVAEAGVAIR